jgi:predicted transcriptional regulator YdeE
MKPRLIEHDRLILGGFNFYGDPFASSGGWTEENEIGRLWQRFMGCLERSPEDPACFKTLDVTYEVHVGGEETESKGYVDVFVGAELHADLVAALAGTPSGPDGPAAQQVPLPLLIRVLPATTYAVFTLRGEQITSDWPRRIYTAWLPASPYRSAHNYLIERYDARFKGLDQIAESELDIYVPVQA